jgi:hypothetical protein
MTRHSSGALLSIGAAATLLTGSAPGSAAMTVENTNALSSSAAMPTTTKIQGYECCSDSGRLQWYAHPQEAGHGVGKTDRFLRAFGDPVGTMGYAAFLAESPGKFDSFVLFAMSETSNDAVVFELFFLNEKTHQTVKLRLKGPSDVYIGRLHDSKCWTYLPRKDYRHDARLENCRLYKIVAEFEHKEEMRHVDLGDMTVTYIKDNGQPAIVNPTEFDLDYLGCTAIDP